MKYVRSMMLPLFVCLAVAVIAGPAAADHFIKQVVHSDAVEMMGQTQPASDDTTSVWVSEGKSCMIDAEGKSYIYHAADNMFYMVDPSKKTYSQMKADFSGAVDDAVGEDNTEEAEKMKAMANQMMGSMKVTVTPTEETKTIGDWQATKYVMEISMPMGKTATEIWSTEDVEIDYEAFKSVANGSMAIMPGYDKILEEMQKIKGIPVYSVTEMSMMGATMKSTMEVIDLSDADAPAGTFDVPEGYKKVDMMQMGR